MKKELKIVFNEDGSSNHKDRAIACYEGTSKINWSRRHDSLHGIRLE